MPPRPQPLLPPPTPICFPRCCAAAGLQVRALDDRISDWCEALRAALPPGEADSVGKLSVGDAAQVRAQANGGPPEVQDLR